MIILCGTRYWQALASSKLSHFHSKASTKTYNLMTTSRVLDMETCSAVRTCKNVSLVQYLICSAQQQVHHASEGVQTQSFQLRNPNTEALQCGTVQSNKVSGN